jgi:hypothetical protein
MPLLAMRTFLMARCPPTYSTYSSTEEKLPRGDRGPLLAVLDRGTPADMAAPWVLRVLRDNDLAVVLYLAPVSIRAYKARLSSAVCKEENGNGRDRIER